MDLIEDLEKRLRQSALSENILPMEKYMKHRFQYFGVKSPDRRKIFKESLKFCGIPPLQNYQDLILEMMNYQKREMHYCAIDLAIRCQKKYSGIEDYKYISEMLAINSWWDTVDLISTHLLGNYLSEFPENRKVILNTFLNSDNMWWHRSTLLFQLKYRLRTDKDLLFELCKRFSSSQEFFIQKAIGWALREYAKTDSKAVYDFVDRTELSNLSVREANKHRI